MELDPSKYEIPKCYVVICPYNILHRNNQLSLCSGRSPDSVRRLHHHSLDFPYKYPASTHQHCSLGLRGGQDGICSKYHSSHAIRDVQIGF
ncbi:hypothetical protein VTN49DRAFT_5277 [Thermomyces lanuginosus]|uniref:uncharacterized protein n=1 Tax=Thermomyces lanuginosus TaxID=5541 RepID=UPI0037437B51